MHRQVTQATMSGQAPQDTPITYPPLPQRPSPAFIPPRPSSPVRSSSTTPAFGFHRAFSNAKRRIITYPSLIGWLYERLQTRTTQLMIFFHPFFLFFLHLVFLVLPVYYSSKAKAMYKDNDANQCLQDFREWTRRSLQLRQLHPWSGNPDRTPSTSAVQPAHIQCNFQPDIVSADTPHNSHNVTSARLPIQPSQSPNASEGSATVLAMQSQPAPSAHPYSTPFHTMMTEIPLPDSILMLHSAWRDYIQSCVNGWRVSLTVSGFLFCTAPSIFQIPNATDDPLPRTFAFFAVFRAIVGVVYSPVLLCYFSADSETRSVEFAILWTRETRAVRGGGMKWGPWVMLSLPLSATLWAIILYGLSMLAFMWRVISTAEHKDIHAPLSEPSMISLCSVLTAVTILDIVGGVWTWRQMAWYKRELHKMQLLQALDA